VLQHARAIHAESEEDRRHIQRYLPGANVFVVPSGAYPARLNAPTGLASAAERWLALRGYRIILYLGRLDVNKGIDLLLRGFHAAGAAGAGWRLLLLGPDFAGTQAQMEKLAHRLGINEELVWAGMVSEEEKRLALQSCDFYVLPSLSENFGISVLEALCCSRPVITTTATPWAKLEEVGAGLRILPTVESLAAALRQWMALPKAQLDEMGRRGYRWALGEYDWEVVAARLKDVYAQILDSRARLCSPPPQSPSASL